ncbi:HxlR family transcriptional regulator [Stackebrandtia albiflava]|uniref:HxlR family transcriptional regulator n=1 Tax=Stackebrandtia albiflava TaxID=406432 RepID=A0A562VBK4_9ACTN|nr:HxlR family transcriptional regulator [Stackebrandtia albiflava]
MPDNHRSECPINLSLEVFGDRWTLLILRDMIFGGRRHFRELLLNSEEGIASNILSARLKRLVGLGMLTRSPDPGHRQKAVYSLTEPAIALLPVMEALGAWGSRWLPVSDALSIRARLLTEGGPELLTRFMAELRHEHLGAPAPEPGGPTVRERLQAGYLKAIARRSAGSASTGDVDDGVTERPHDAGPAQLADADVQPAAGRLRHPGDDVQPQP